MVEAIIGLVSAVGGTVIGCYVTWLLMNRQSRNQTRGEVLVRAAEELQDFRVTYAVWYTEYLSSDAQETKGHWAKPVTENTDPVFLELLSSNDRARGRLRVIRVLLAAHFPESVIGSLRNDIHQILCISAEHANGSVGQVDDITERICDSLPDLIGKYS